MRAGRMSYTVERFGTVLSPTGNGCNLSVAGWFHADSTVKSMSLEIESGKLTVYPIVDFNLPSEDVAGYFGASAANKRFHLVTEIDSLNVALTNAYLQIVLVNGDQHSLDITNMFKPHVVRAVSSASDLVMCFESLGDNCEFGLMQRQIGRERLGLFRYGGTLSTAALVEGFNSRFAGFATKDDLQFHLSHGEWICVSRRYGYVFHTRRYENMVTEEQIREEQSAHLSFLARMLLEDVETGEKIFVRRIGGFEGTGPEHGMDTLYNVLRSIGPAKLLWVTPVNAEHPSAKVIHLHDGLFRGYIEKLAPYENAHDFSVPAWITLLTNTVETLEESYHTQSALTIMS